MNKYNSHIITTEEDLELFVDLEEEVIVVDTPYSMRTITFLPPEHLSFL